MSRPLDADPPAPDRLHHLVREREWSLLVSDGRYAPESLDSEGFIHLSTVEQVPETVARWYRDESDLLVVTVDAAALGPGLRWENRYGHGDFPHLYGPLSLETVVEVEPYREWIAGLPRST